MNLTNTIVALAVFVIVAIITIPNEPTPKP